MNENGRVLSVVPETRAGSVLINGRGHAQPLRFWVLIDLGAQEGVPRWMSCELVPMERTLDGTYVPALSGWTVREP
jgi:hypothetical protein